jgi:aldose 1-epimerase
VTNGPGPSDAIVLEGEGATLTIDAEHGARLASLVVDGHELLVTEGDGPIWWGCYPMAPFAGRIRDGRFPFRDELYDIPLSMPPNAIHGTVLDRPWQVTARSADGVELATDLGPDWPFRGRVVQAITLVAGGMEAALRLEAVEPMPAVLGWHPWFRRSVGGASAQLAFEAHSMYLRGPDGLPTGMIGPPSPGPWDDAFADLVAQPRLTWPGILELDIRSTALFWVVFDEREDALCVEPQTAPPDAFNLAWAAGVEPPMAAPDRPATIAMAWRWTRPERPARAPAVRPSRRRPSRPARSRR